MPKALTVETRTGLSISALRLKTRRVCVCVCVCVRTVDSRQNRVILNRKAEPRVSIRMSSLSFACIVRTVVCYVQRCGR